MLLVRHCLLCRRSRVLNSAGTAVVSDMMRVGYDAGFDDCTVYIGGVNICLIHANHRRVIRKRVAAPFAACEPDATESEAVVHAAVVAHVLAPVTVMKSVLAAVPAPVRRCPHCAHVRGWHPRAWIPVVVPIVVGIRPVAGRPHQIWLGAYRLLIYGQSRRSEANIDGDAKLGMDRNCRNWYQQSKQE
jgi:hypothetical protein